MCICIYRCAELYRSGKHPQQLQKQREYERQYDTERHLREKELKLKKDCITMKYQSRSYCMSIEGDQQYVFNYCRELGFTKEGRADNELNDGRALT